jgi:DNA helicase-2/ATP-dependent DNA helicase PcrA
VSQQSIASPVAEMPPEEDRPPIPDEGETITAAQTRTRALEDLNREQRVAVAHPPGSLLVIAPAGTGKTRVLTHRIAWLIGSGIVRPEEVLAITLTNKAAREMLDRARKMCGPVAERIDIGTFHATCARLLRSHPDLIDRSSHFTIYDESDALSVVNQTLRRAERARLKPKKVQREISLNKNQALSASRYASFATDEASRIVARVWQAYEEELKRADALDFDDLLVRTVDLLAGHADLRVAYQQKWRAVLVDEYQDTNPIQARLLRLLVGGEGNRNFMFVGDDRQVIYGFRLADIRLILDFEQEYHDASVVTLRINYRSTKQILDAANRLMTFNLAQREVTLLPDEETEPGPEVMVHGSSNETEEAQWIALQIQKAIDRGIPEREIAVVGRWASVVERVEHTLAVAGISYELIASRRFFSRKEVKLALAHLRVLVNPRDEAAFAYALAIRPRVGDSTIAKIIAYANRHGLTLLEAAAAVHMIPGISARTTRENVSSFAYEMLAFTGRLDSTALSTLAHEVIHMPHGVGEFVANSDDSEQRMERLKTLPEAARAYERQHDEPTLAEWLQDALLAGRDDRAGPSGERGRVTLGTIHAVKGLEWELVFGAGMEGRILPSFWAGTRSAIEEERRMAYVLLTRGRRWVVLCYAQTREGRQSGPSRFISEAISVPDGANTAGAVSERPEA